MTFSRNRSHALVAAASTVTALVLCTAATVAHGTTYDEAVQGDLSNNASAPTSVGALTAGLNQISGTTIPHGTFDPDTHSYSVLDNDYVTFTVPTGYVLSGILLDGDSIIQTSDRLFLGIAQGSGVSVDPSFSSAAGLLGWTLAGASMVGTDVLPALGASAPIDFPSIGGATGFTGSLASGQYTLWILDGDSPVSYDFKLTTVAAVPEPEEWMMLLGGLACIGRTLQRRRQSSTRISTVKEAPRQ